MTDSITIIDKPTVMYDVTLPLLPFPLSSISKYEEMVQAIIDSKDAYAKLKIKDVSVASAAEEAASSIVIASAIDDKEKIGGDLSRRDDEVAVQPKKAVVVDTLQYTQQEEFEAHESLGIVLYYCGHFFNSSKNLLKAFNILSALPNKDSNNASYLRICIYCGLSYYRLADLPNAEKYFALCLNRKNKAVLHLSAVALSNLALVKLGQHKPSDAMDKAREGLEAAIQYYTGNSSTANTSGIEILNHAKVLLAIYIKCGELTRAQQLLDDHDFDPKEKMLIAAGCCFAAGNYDDAYTMLIDTGSTAHDEALEPVIQDSNASTTDGTIAAATATSGNDFMTPPPTAPDNGSRVVDEELAVAVPIAVSREEQLIKQWTNTLFDAQMAYNKYCLQVRSVNNYDADILDRVSDSIERLFNDIKAESQDQQAFGDIFEYSEPDILPNFTPFDGQLASGAILSHVLLSKAEAALMNANFNEGLQVQVGLPLGDVNVDDIARDKIQHSLNLCIQSIKHINMNNQPLYDIAVTTDIIDNYRIYCDISNAKMNGTESDTSLTAVAEEVTYAMQTKYGIYVNEKTGQRIPPSETSKVALKFPVKSNKHPVLRNYLSSKHDFSTVRNEVFLLVKRFTRNEVALWVQWSLCNTGGLGYGFMGIISPDTIPVEGIAVAGTGSTQIGLKVQESFLKEVRQRLVEVEYELSNAYDKESSYSIGDKEVRILLLASLSKVSAQLNLRKETIEHVKAMEQLTASLQEINRYNMQCNDWYYIALAKRFRYDAEEWTLSTISSSEKKLEQLLVLLDVSKCYVDAADQCNDMHLRRDSLKKVINTYIDISNCHTAIEVSPGTEEKYRMFKEREMTEKEKSNGLWVKEFSRIRLKVYLNRYKDLSSHFNDVNKPRYVPPVCEEEPTVEAVEAVVVDPVDGHSDSDDDSYNSNSDD